MSRLTNTQTNSIIITEDNKYSIGTLLSFLDSQQCDYQEYDNVMGIIKDHWDSTDLGDTITLFEFLEEFNLSNVDKNHTILFVPDSDGKIFFPYDESDSAEKVNKILHEIGFTDYIITDSEEK